MSSAMHILGNFGEIIMVFARLAINIKYVIGKRWKGKRTPSKNMLLIANGPSLRHTNLRKILCDETEIICVNYFPCKDARFFELKPRYLCILDPSILRDAPYENLQLLNQQLKNVLERVDWKLDIISSWRTAIKINNDRIGYIGLTPIAYTCKFMRKFLYSHNLAGTGFQNVAIGALFFAVLSGAERIYLAGVDNSEFKGYEVNEFNEVFVSVEHHYGNGKNKLKTLPKGHFAKQLQCYCRMFEQYYNLADYISTCTNVKVVNLNPYSFVDVFEKTSEFYDTNQKL